MGNRMLALTLAVAAGLLCFSLRRLLFVAAALLPPRRLGPAPADPLRVTLIVPARNEAANLAPTLDALTRLEHPPGRLLVAEVNDGSDDDTGRVLADWAAQGDGRVAVDFALPLGKYRALDRVAASTPSDLIAVCDADLVPDPSWLARMVEPFGDPRVAATAGYTCPSNPTATWIARYASVETWTHLLVASAGKDRLGLNPPTHGNAVYRRGAFEDVGGFATRGAGGDVRISVALTRAGWRTRFVPGATTRTAVAATWSEYWHQHIRWARNLFAAAAPTHAVATRCGPVQRLELAMLTAGYIDRLLLFAALALACSGQMSFWWPFGYLAVIGLQVVVGLHKAGAEGDSVRFLAATATVLAVDVAASLVAVLAHLLSRPPAWRSARGDAPQRQRPAR
jgi:cellulose synthase/poly-beta-1,6-N-acetylglucosamine synthase-like glycosyltransferase